MLLTVPLAGQCRDLYRYTNDKGIMVLDDRIPADHATRGYEVLNEEGVVIEVVPRALSVEEQARQDVKELLAEAAAAEQERLRKWDHSLLLRYSTIEDIEAARERALRDLRIRVSILKSNARSLKQQVENYQSIAADTERSGGTVDVKVLAAIEELQTDIAVTDRSIVDRQAEVARVQEEFQLDIERFGMLLDLVELRRSLLATDR
ncbi:MAG: hypothetical protein IMF06_05940 [Proteobacteria bacterium]|nr:hypothetical protein [Pseudomonadota bacterium]